jgi:hypothetical protein
MGEGQCWLVYANGWRCAEPALPGMFFCSRHRDVRMHEVSRIWRAPEAEMPRELVAAIRRADPAITFPASTPAPSSPTGPPAPSSGSPGSVPHPGHGSASSAPPVRGETTASPLDWLMATLQAAMEGVMAGDATPLQKANAVARLTGQYLKAYGVKELERENKALIRRLAALEAHVAALEACAASAERPATAMTGEADPPAGSPEQGREREGNPDSMDVPDEVWVSQTVGEPLATRPAARAVSASGAIAAEGRVPP